MTRLMEIAEEAVRRIVEEVQPLRVVLFGSVAQGEAGPDSDLEDWLSRAQGKLALAQQPLPPGGYWEDLCFMAQQAGELSIKAVHQRHGWQFPFIHDLRKLLDGLEAKGLPFRNIFARRNG